MNFKLFLTLFFLIVAQVKAIDITQEFCKETQTPDKVCAQLQVFKEDYNRLTTIKLAKKDKPDTTGIITYYKTESDTNKIVTLSVDPDLQKKGIGSSLLRYALAQCKQDCAYSSLLASPFLADQSEKKQEFEKLKKFYEKHGGLPLYEEAGCWARFIFFERY
jgi:GNAT superfamily N-acetyltransferase